MLPSLSRTPIPRKDLAPKPQREKRPDPGTPRRCTWTFPVRHTALPDAARPTPGPPPSLEKAPDQRDHVAHEGVIRIEVRRHLGVPRLQTVRRAHDPRKG